MKNKKNFRPTAELPAIPEKRYFTIGEVSVLCAVKPHVLRYWEQEFTVLRPGKRRGSRRYYQEKDIQTARNIRELLYDRGFTINGARQELTRKPTVVPVPVAPKAVSEKAANQFVANVLTELEGLLTALKTEAG